MSDPFCAPIYLRAYTEKPGIQPVAQKSGSIKIDAPSPITLILDTETTTDAAQTLRFGVCQIRRSGELKRTVLFYSEELSDAECETLRAYAQLRGHACQTVAAFRKDVFLKYGYRANAVIVGFNLPFDIARLALSYSEARGSMRGGFSFALSPYKSEPNIRIKHLSASAALIDFARPGKQLTGRGMRKRGFKARHNRGFLIDVKTIAMALTSRKHSLKSLAEFLQVPTQKHETGEHGGALTEAYLDYACADVQATWECFDALKTMYESHGLSTPLHKILSEASIGKAYLKQMGIQPLLKCQPDIPREGFGRIMSAYYGGRAEVRIRRDIAQVLYCDFKSMYPTVNALMNLNRFVIADGYSEHEATAETQAFLDSFKIEDLKRRDAWRRLTTLVKLCPANDVLPVRTRYSEGKDNLTIGLNHLTSETPLWFTLADVLVSKILAGKTPRILEAIRYEPGPLQEGLKPINLFGREEYRIDPNQDDMFIRLIDLRDEAKARKDPLQQQIKIIANATCYGIFVEVNRDDAPKPEALMLYDADSESHEISSTALEEPGRYFHPLLATLITGAARLMLATAERLASDQGLGWVFCDTDSIAMARPNGMDSEAFYSKTQNVIDWFEPLNPYAKSGSILKVEDANNNFDGVIQPLYCFAISAKRYALFNLNRDNKPVLRKASAHGLGAFMPPYTEDNPSGAIPKPVYPLKELGVNLWQHDYWYKVIEAALDGHSHQVLLDYHPALKSPAIRRYGATSPALLRWMGKYNEGKAKSNQVKPFGFMVAPLASTGVWAEVENPDILATVKRGRPHKQKSYKPIAPFERDTWKAAQHVFDRETGEPVPTGCLKTYAEALALFHLSPEDKFKNGAPWDTGLTLRRYVVATDITLIGKEANKVGEHGQPYPTNSDILLHALS
ncbi:MAG: hypothetical protein ABNH49_04925 [Hyphomonas sp.]|jgi:hypothetical protein